MIDDVLNNFNAIEFVDCFVFYFNASTECDISPLPFSEVAADLV